jgi:hypothetical protein
MLPRFLMALGMLTMTTGGLLADEIRGTVRNIEPARNVVVLTIGDQDRMFEVARQTPVYTLISVGRPRRSSLQLQQNTDGLNALQPGMYVTVLTENREGVQAVTQIREDNVTSYAPNSRRRRR